MAIEWKHEAMAAMKRRLGIITMMHDVDLRAALDAAVEAQGLEEATWEVRAESAERKVEELREALKPFVVPRNAKHSGALHNESVVFDINGHELKVGDFRRARAVYEKIKGGGND